MVIAKPTRASSDKLQSNPEASHLEMKAPAISNIKTNAAINTNLELTKPELHHANRNTEKPKTPITIERANQLSKRTVSSMLGDLRKFCNLAAAAFCASAAIMVKILPESSPIRKSVENGASGFARLAIGVISGATGAVDAIKSGKHLLAGAQIGDAITSVVSPINDMTNHRGLWIGAYNALPALETIHGKVTYTNFQDYLKTNWTALQSISAKFLKNPLGLFDPQQKGELGVISGIAMSVSSLLYMLTGLKFFATTRNVLGMTVEGEKLKSKHLAEGRGRYAASGYLMMAGSAANIMSQYSKSNSGLWSYVNLFFNALGKDRYQAALRANEPAKINSPITFKDMVVSSLSNMFRFGKETEAVLNIARPMLVKIEDQPIAVQKQVQAATKNGVSNNLGSMSRVKASPSVRTAVPVMNKVASKVEVVAPKVAKAPMIHHKVPKANLIGLDHVRTRASNELNVREAKPAFQPKPINIPTISIRPTAIANSEKPLSVQPTGSSIPSPKTSQTKVG